MIDKIVAPKFIEVSQTVGGWSDKVMINTDQILHFKKVQQHNGKEYVEIHMTHGVAYRVMESYSGLVAKVAGLTEI